MKCAIEILKEKAEAEEMERLNRIKREEQERELIIKRTLEWCETEVAEALEKEASNTLNPNNVVKFYVKFYDDPRRYDTEFTVLRKETTWRGNEVFYTSGRKDFSVLKDYLEKHCFDVDYQFDSLRCWNFGTYHYGAILSIFISEKKLPKCLDF